MYRGAHAVILKPMKLLVGNAVHWRLLHLRYHIDMNVYALSVCGVLKNGLYTPSGQKHMSVTCLCSFPWFVLAVSIILKMEQFGWCVLCHHIV
jgi:hypothetical protein